MTGRTTSRPLAFVLALAVLAACAAPQTPPQLAHTPGVPVTISDGRLRTPYFSALIPDGWRVITPAADAPMGFIYAAPDDAALIALSSAPMDSPPALPGVSPDAQRVTRETVQIEDLRFDAALVSAGPASAALRAQFDAVIDSLRRER